MLTKTQVDTQTRHIHAGKYPIKVMVWQRFHLDVYWAMINCPKFLLLRVVSSESINDQPRDHLLSVTRQGLECQDREFSRCCHKNNSNFCHWALTKTRNSSFCRKIHDKSIGSCD